MTVIYREREYLDKYKYIDTTRSIKCVKYWKPEGVSLYYFQLNAFNFKTISEDDIIKIIED